MFKSIDLQFRFSNCEFASLDVKATQIHLKICGKPDDFECFVCDKSFKTEKILSKHHSLIHGLSDGYEDTEINDHDHANDKPNLNKDHANDQAKEVSQRFHGAILWSDIVMEFSFSTFPLWLIECSWIPSINPSAKSTKT